MPFVSFNWRLHNIYFLVVDIDIVRKNFQGIMFSNVAYWLYNMHLGVFT